MGNDKRKRTKQTPESDMSDFDENNQPPTTPTNDTPQHFPRFIPLGIKLSALPRPWGLNSHWERC